jgi:Fe-S-cluster containining protein
MNLNNITLVFFIESLIQETLLTNNPLLKSKFKILLVYPETYQARLLFDKAKISLKCRDFKQALPEILKIIDTEWLIYLKPEEIISGEINLNDSAPAYRVKIDLVRISASPLSYYELRIFHKSFLVKKNKGEAADITILNYSKGFPALETFKFKNNIELYRQGNRELGTLVYLYRKGFLATPVNELLEIADLFKSRNVWNHHLLELYIAITENLIRDNNLLKAKNILYEILGKYNNAAELYFLLAEIHLKLDENTEAGHLFTTCINLIDTKKYYKYTIIDKARLISFAYFYLGKIYLKAGDFSKAKDVFEICLIINSGSTQFKKAYRFAEKQNRKSIGNINELDFSCQSCGNSCRTFDVDITAKDISRILKNRPDLKPEQFINHSPLNNSRVYEYFIDNDGEKKKFTLKKQEGSRDCIFLENNMCTIHDFKPLICKVFPFTTNPVDNSISWSMNHKEFIKDLCSYKLIRKNNDAENLRKVID